MCVGGAPEVLLDLREWLPTGFDPTHGREVSPYLPPATFHVPGSAPTVPPRARTRLETAPHPFLGIRTSRTLGGACPTPARLRAEGTAAEPRLQPGSQTAPGPSPQARDGITWSMAGGGGGTEQLGIRHLLPQESWPAHLPTTGLPCPRTDLSQSCHCPQGQAACILHSF